jgi:hypothetical protein
MCGSAFDAAAAASAAAAEELIARAPRYCRTCKERRGGAVRAAETCTHAAKRAHARAAAPPRTRGAARGAYWVPAAAPARSEARAGARGTRRHVMPAKGTALGRCANLILLHEAPRCCSGRARACNN